MKKYYLIGAVMHKYLSAVYISFFLLVVSGWSNVGFAHEGHGEVIQGAPTAMPNRPSASRVSQADRYEQLNVRMDRLRTQDCQKQYFLHKAQAWLNISREFYHEGDGAAAVDAAFGEALAIVESLEKGLLPSVETKLIQNADKVRPDLWVMASERKVNSGSSCCAIKETAYCEVALVRAGHAQANLGGIARTQPLIGMAQDLCTTAKEAKCVVASVVMQTPQAVSTPATTSPAVAIAPRDAAKTEPKLAIKQTPVIQISYSADAFFDKNKATLKAKGKESLAELLAKIQTIELETIFAVGHTDSDGSNADNQLLSQRRANAVKAYLVKHGINTNRIQTSGKGESSPVASNTTVEGKAKNRRVDIDVVGR